MKKQRAKWLLFTCTGLIMAGLLAACGPADDPTPAPEPTVPAAPGETPGPATPTPEPVTDLPDPQSPSGEVNIATGLIDPAGGLNSAFHNLYMVYWGVAESLVTTEHGTEGPVLEVPWLARAWEIAPDLTSITFEIQEGVQFHDDWGELTAEDIVWSVNDANSRVNPESVSGVAGDLSMFEAFEVVDTYTVHAPIASWDSRWFANGLGLGLQPLPIWSATAAEENGRDWARDNFIGTGPFKMQTHSVQDRMILEAVDDHWRQTAAANVIRVTAVPDATARLAQLTTGQVDIAGIELKDTPDMLEQGFLAGGTQGGSEMNIPIAGNLWETHHASTGEELTRGGFKPEHPWIGDPDDADSMEQARLVRWALAMALDRETIAEVVGAGLAWPSYIGMFNPVMPEWQDEWAVPYDPELAMEYLEEAGYPDGFHIVLYGQTPGLRAEMSHVVGDYWRDIGLDVEVWNFPYATWRPNIVDRTAEYPHLNSCDDGRTPRPWDWPVGATSTSLTRGGFACAIEDPFIAETFLTVAAEPDRAERVRLNNEVAAHMHHWMTMPSVITFPSYMLYNPRAIDDWQARPSLSGPMNSPETIVPAAR